MKFSGSEQAEMVLKIHKPRMQKIVEHFFSDAGGSSPRRMSSRKGSKRQIIPEDEHLNATGAGDAPEWLQECLNVYQSHKHTSQKGSIQEVRVGILGLSVNIGLFIVQAQAYFQNGISKLLTASLNKLLAEIKHTENDTTTFARLSLLKPEFSEKPEQLSQLTDLLGDMLYCFYAIMDTLLSQRDLRGKILNDETLTVGLASAAASHMASDFLSSISGILDSFLQWCSESVQFVTLFAQFGLTNFDFQHAKVAVQSKAAFRGKTAGSKRGVEKFLSFVINVTPKSITEALLSTDISGSLVLDLQEPSKLIATILFAVDPDSIDSAEEFTKYHLAKLVFEDQTKLRLFRHYLAAVLHSKDFKIACFWLEYFSDMYLSYMDHIRLVESKAPSAGSKAKNAKLGFLSCFYETITPYQQFSFSESLTNSAGSLKEVVYRLADKTLVAVRRVTTKPRHEDHKNQHIPCSAFLFFNQNLTEITTSFKKGSFFDGKGLKASKGSSSIDPKSSKDFAVQRRLSSSKMESDLLVALTELLKPLGNQQPHLIFSRVTLTQLLLSAFVSTRRDARLPGDRTDTDMITGRKRASLEDFDFGKQKQNGQKKPQKTISLDQSVLQAIAVKFQSFIEVMTTQEVEGLLQLVFIRQLNLCIETGFKTCGIVANTEMNEQLRSSFFGAYLDGFHVSHGLFIRGQHLPQGSSIPTSEIFEKILLRRSSDSSAEVRLTAAKLVHRILFSVPEDAAYKAQLRVRLFITVLLPRLLDVDSRVKNSAVRTSAKCLFLFKELSPILTKPETLAPLVQACLRTDNLSEEETTNIEYLCCALVFGAPDGPQNRSLDEKVAEQTNATLEDARRRISSKIKFEVKRHQAQAEVMIESLSHIVALLRDQVAEAEDHSKVSLILSRACIAFIKDTSCEEESIMELIFALYRIATKTSDSQSGLAFRCIACLIREAPKSPNLLRGIGHTFSPQFVVSTLQLLGKDVSASSFEPRIKTLQEFYSSFSVTRADLKEDGCALIEKALPLALNKFWSSEPKLMKCLSKFFVTLSQTLAKSDILSGLVSKSINFLLQVKNTLQEREKQRSGSRNKKNAVDLPKIEDEQYVRPLRIAFYSIYLILSNSPVGALDKEVASYVADLCMDLLKVKDSEVFKYSLGSLYFLSLSQAATQTEKAQKKSKLDEEEPAVQGFKPLVAQMTSAADSQEPYCIPGILFVSMLFVERKRTKNGDPSQTAGLKLPKAKGSRKSDTRNKSKAQSKPKKDKAPSGSSWTVLDSNITSFWRAHSDLLFRCVEDSSLCPVEQRLEALDVMKELSLDRELPLRNVFITINSLIIHKDLEISGLAREIIKELIIFDSRILNETHQHQILTKLLSKDLLEGVLDERVALLDSIWDLESDLGLGKEANSMFTGYLSGYIKDFIKAKNTLSLLPNKVLDVAHAQKLSKDELREYLASSLAGQEVILFFTLFASTKHRVQDLAVILLAILRLVEQRVGDTVLLLDELEEGTSNQLSSEEGRSPSPSGPTPRNAKKNVGGKTKPADRKPPAAVVAQTATGDGLVRLSGKHASLKNLMTIVAGCEALKMWIFVIKSFESLLEPIGNQNFNSSQAGLLGSFSVRKALDQLISGGVKAQKPGLFKYSFSRVVGALPTSFKTYDRAVFELVDAASAGSASTAGKPGVVVPTHIIEDLRKVAGHIADSSLAEVLQTDCGDWKKPDKISNFGKKQTQKGRRPAKRAKKGRRQSHGWSDDSDSDEAANHYSDESEDSDDFLPVKKQKR